MYIYICNLIAMLMLSAVAPMHSCVCCCLLVSVLSSCVLYAPMHYCICSGSSCVLYVCLLYACLCFHVWLMIVLVLVLYVCLYLHHPHVQVTPTQQLQQLWELLLQCILACAKKTKQKQELMVCTALYSSAQHAKCEELANVQSLLANVHMSLWLVALPMGTSCSL